jgi:hydroxymethylglutaryl-CoA reductase
MAVGTVGGATKVHPTAKVAMKILNVESAQELAQVLACVGLAQNLAAIKALSTVGIQQGHMRLHARQVATAAGATPEQVPEVTERMIADKQINSVRAQEILAELNS